MDSLKGQWTMLATWNWSALSEDHEADVISVSSDIDYRLLEALPDLTNPDKYENFEPMITRDFTPHGDFINSLYSVMVKSTMRFFPPNSPFPFTALHGEM